MDQDARKAKAAEIVEALREMGRKVWHSPGAGINMGVYFEISINPVRPLAAMVTVLDDGSLRVSAVNTRQRDASAPASELAAWVVTAAREIEDELPEGYKTPRVFEQKHWSELYYGEGAKGRYTGD